VSFSFFSLTKETLFYPVKAIVRLIQCINLAYKLRTKTPGEEKKIKEKYSSLLRDPPTPSQPPHKPHYTIPLNHK
jgi:hypothetical protein